MQGLLSSTSAPLWVLTPTGESEVAAVSLLGMLSPSAKTHVFYLFKNPTREYYTQLLMCLCPQKFWIIKVERIISQVLNSAQHRRDVLGIQGTPFDGSPFSGTPF